MLTPCTVANSKIVVLDFEGFRHKKSGFIIKEISVQSKYFSDTILVCPPTDFSCLTNSEQKSHCWVSKYLHGLDWNIGDFPYCFLNTYFILLILRFPSAVFYAKGLEKCEKLSDCLKKPVHNLEDLNCPKFEELSNQSDLIACDFHSKSTPQRQKQRHCANKKAKFFFNWLEKHLNETVSSSSQLVSQFDDMQLHGG